MKRVYQVDIDRVTIAGAGAGVRAADLRPLVEAAIAREVGSAALPSGRTMRASVRIDAGPLTGAARIASAIASGVVRATGRGARRG